MDWKNLRKKVSGLLGAADIRLDGDRSWDPVVHDPRLFPRVVAEGTLGLGEAYVDGWWDCQALDELATRAIAGGVDERIHSLAGLRDGVLARLTNLQKPSRAREIGRKHYDLGNDLFAAMLDDRLLYSCGYWHAARSLEEAQEAKLDLVANKLDMKPGMHLLDIGCGWGGRRNSSPSATRPKSSVSPSRRRRQALHVRSAEGCRWRSVSRTTGS